MSNLRSKSHFQEIISRSKKCEIKVGKDEAKRSVGGRIPGKGIKIDKMVPNKKKVTEAVKEEKSTMNTTRRTSMMMMIVMRRVIENL